MTASAPRHEGLPDEVVAAFSGTQGFVDHIGLVVDFVSPTRVTGHLEVSDTLLQPYGLLHGGVHAAIVETLGSIGGAANVAARTGDLSQGVVGVANQTDFLRPVTSGRVEAVATPVHAGGTQQLWQVEITREDTKVAARGQLRVQVIDMQA